MLWFQIVGLARGVRANGYLRCGACTLLMAALALGCQYDPYASTYATSQPDRSNIIGTWRLSLATRERLKNGPYAKLEPVIDLRADGTVRMRDIPDNWTSLDGAGRGGPSTFDGDWKLFLEQGKWWSVDLRHDQWGCSFCLAIIGNRPPHRLRLTYGDPDAGGGYEFERSSDQR